MSADAGDTFASIYQTDEWSGGSGVGSTPDATARYRDIVARLVASPDVGSVVDVGCGDWQLGSLVDWSGVSYTGLDVVPAVVEANRQRFGGANVTFDLVDAMSDPLPDTDLLLVKDVLQHWPNAAVRGFLDTHLPRYRYVLVTNDVASVHWPREVNEDIALGAWRTLDLEAPPFDRPAVWRGDFDVRGEWTKRILLYAGRAARASSRWRRSTGLRRLRGF